MTFQEVFPAITATLPICLSGILLENGLKRTTSRVKYSSNLVLLRNTFGIPNSELTHVHYWIRELATNRMRIRYIDAWNQITGLDIEISSST